MELKVWVEGIQRIVCGVTEVTTCQDVVYALAHATGKTGRFTLMERWRNSERLLAPHEHPLKILLKWGEYASDVQFILQRTALEPKTEYRQESKLVQSYPPNQRSSQPLPGVPQRINNKGPASGGDPSPPKGTPQSPQQNRDIKKSLTFSGGHSSHHPSAEGIGPPEVGAHPPQGFIPKLSPLSHPHSYPPIHQDSSAVGHPRHQYPPNTSPLRHYSINRPPAPPPYELVRGHPPPPPPGSLRHPYQAYGAYSQPKEWRNPPPPLPTQNPSSGRPSQPPFQPFRASSTSPGYARPPRELPPYRDPPPPPPPSHPALMKISPPKGNHSHSPSAISEGSPPIKSFDKDKMYFSGKVVVGGSGEPSPNNKERGERLHAVSRESGPLGHKLDEPVGLYSSQMPSKVLDKSKKDDSRSSKDQEDNCVDESSKSLADRPNSPLKTGQREGYSISGERNENSNTSNNLTKGVASEGDKNVVQSIIKQLVKSSAKEMSSLSGNNNNNNHSTEEVIVDGYYRELVKLVNQQREKISAQQIDLTKFEAEIAFSEGRQKEEESRLAYLQEEIQRMEKAPEKPIDLKLLTQLEEQLKAAKKAESTSKDDVAVLQKKVAACDHKLSQMNTRIRSIEEALRQEELNQQQKAQEAYQEEEQEALRREIEKLQMAVEQATHQANNTQELSNQLSQEMQDAENRLEERRKEIETLKQAMRDANLEALSMTPPDEAKALSETRPGSTKSGTIRRMVGSPRQLETAVPTSKNPHGVWV